MSELNKRKIQQVSVPVVYENGILFTYAGKEKDQVFISGSFWGWAKKLKLSRNHLGIYYAFVPLEIKKGKYAYRYQVNNIWMNDPQQTQYMDDGFGTRMSFMTIERDLNQYLQSPIPLGENKFKFILKDENYSQVSWVGSMNNWDPYVSRMQLIDRYWEIEITLKPDQTFYRFWVDGKHQLDPLNSNIARKRGGEDVSYLPFHINKTP